MPAPRTCPNVRPWNSSLHRQLESMRLVLMPIVNPGGLARATRANPNGVDLMRNAPIDALDAVPWLIGGQRISASLPWYRGAAGAPMEPESRAVCEVVAQELFTHRFSMAVDCHSGFGTRDRVWFPYAHTARPFAHLADVWAFKRIFDQTHPQHRYVVEPQSHQYLTHGDLWAYLCLRSLTEAQGSQQLARAWGRPVASHPTAGHDLPLDDAPWVARRVPAWLAGTGRA